jgi:hypothetical protein
MISVWVKLVFQRSFSTVHNNNSLFLLQRFFLAAWSALLSVFWEPIKRYSAGLKSEVPVIQYLDFPGYFSERKRTKKKKKKEESLVQEWTILILLKFEIYELVSNFSDPYNCPYCLKESDEINTTSHYTLAFLWGWNYPEISSFQGIRRLTTIRSIRWSLLYYEHKYHKSGHFTSSCPLWSWNHVTTDGQSVRLGVSTLYAPTERMWRKNIFSHSANGVSKFLFKFGNSSRIGGKAVSLTIQLLSTPARFLICSKPRSH